MVMNIQELVNGTFSLIFVVISIAVGIRITLRYPKQKDRLYLLVGLVFIFIVEIWYPSTISFLIALFTGTDGLKNVPHLYFIIACVGIPLIVLLWMVVFTDLFYKAKQKRVLILFIIFGIGFEITFFVLLSIDPKLIGEIKSAVDVQYAPFVTIYLIIILVIIISTGYIFAHSLMKSNDPEFQLKGKLLLSAFILFVIGAALDSSNFVPEWFLPVTRIILIISFFCFLGGFILPEWQKKIFLRK